MERTDTVHAAGTDIAAPPRPPACAGCAPARRDLLTGVLATGLAAVLPCATAGADEKKPRPQAGDRFVFVSGDKAGAEIKPDDLTADAPPVLAWPLASQTKTARNGSRLAQVLLMRLDPATLDEVTKSHAADGIVAYAATCSHAQCPVTGWNHEKKTLRCPCHNSEYDPREDAKVVFGPAPRPLPALPLKIENGELVAAGTFLGRVGTSSS
jgi:rieske iron-sulfur protein